MAQVAVIAKLDAAEGKGDELAAVITEMVGAVEAQEPGTLIYAAGREGDSFWFYELYADAEAATAHSKGSVLAEAGAKMAGLLGGRPEIHMLEVVAGKGLPG